MLVLKPLRNLKSFGGNRAESRFGSEGIIVPLLPPDSVTDQNLSHKSVKKRLGYAGTSSDNYSFHPQETYVKETKLVEK